METFVTPDKKWLHGVEDGTEYCLGRPSGMKLHFSEEIGFALIQFLPAFNGNNKLLRETVWNFANERPVPLKHPKVLALVHLLKRLCDLRAEERDFEMAVRASDTREIIELRAFLEFIPDGVSPRYFFNSQLRQSHQTKSALADCIRDGIEKNYGSWEKWQKIAREVLKNNAPDTFMELSK